MKHILFIVVTLTFCKSYSGETYRCGQRLAASITGEELSDYLNGQLIDPIGLIPDLKEVFYQSSQGSLQPH